MLHLCCSPPPPQWRRGEEGGLDLFHYPGAGRLLFSLPAVVSHGQSDGGWEKLG